LAYTCVPGEATAITRIAKSDGPSLSSATTRCSGGNECIPIQRAAQSLVEVVSVPLRQSSLFTDFDTMGDVLEFSPSALEVDYDKNLTELYRAITDQDWETAVRVCNEDPDQAATWVVRHYEPEEDEETDEELEIMWRFLPLHSACARQPPASVVSALLRAYPDGARCQDDQGMYTLHYACGNQATRDVIRLLLLSFPEAAHMVDPRGMLPIHYLACWGPSSIAVVDMLLVANRNVAKSRDMDGNTPMDLAKEGDYPERDSVLAALRKWIANGPSNDSVSRAGASHKSASRSTATKRSTKTQGSGRSSVSKTSRARKAASLKKAASVESEEEKKEEEMSHGDPPAQSQRGMVTEAASFASRVSTKSSVSPDEVKRMQVEIRNLTMKLKESSTSETGAKISDQDKIIAQLKKELEDAQESNGLVSSSETVKELDDAKTKLKEAKLELKGLRLSLMEMMEQNQSQKKKSGNTNDRLASLVYSLEAMKERQETLEKSVKDSRDKRKQAHQERKEALAKLLALDHSIDDDDESVVGTSFKKQTKEMEAIAAVINAARD
jgi:hypothetical protein